MNYDSAASLVKAFHFDAFEIIPSQGQCGGIILLWNNNKFNINVVGLYDRFLFCQINDFAHHINWHATFPYMTPQKETKLNFGMLYYSCNLLIMHLG